MKVITELEEPTYYEVYCDIKDELIDYNRLHPSLTSLSYLTEEAVMELLELIEAVGYKIVRIK